MKKNLFLIFASAVIASCSLEEFNTNDNIPESTARIFKAGFADTETKANDHTDSRTFLNYDNTQYWMDNDRIMLFEWSHIGGEYVYHGEDYSREAYFQPVNAQSGSNSATLDFNLAVYPYSKDIQRTSINNVEVTLPGVQYISSEPSFDQNANTMVAMSESPDDTFLPFKNVCGYLRIYIKPDEDMMVKSIRLKGNNGELIAGRATVTAYCYSNPEVVMNEGGETSITAMCDEYGNLSAGASYAFNFIVPPTTFTNGITVEIFTSDKKEMIVSTNNEVPIRRNKITTMSEISFVPNTSYILDENFRTYCLENFDIDYDGKLSQDEIADVEVIECSRMNISSLEGIEFFTSLQQLDCAENFIEELDLSKNVNLISVECGGNLISSINLSGCTAIKHLSVSRNRLINLDVSLLTELETLSFSDNQMKAPNLSNNTKLTKLFCSNNSFLSALDLSNNPELTVVDCHSSQVKSLNVSKCTKLESLYCDNNTGIVSLDVTNCPLLKTLRAYWCNISTLDLSKNAELTSLDVNGNKLTSLDLSAKTKLTKVDCSSNQITSLDISGCTRLATLKCSDNRFTTLNLSDCTQLTSLLCNSTRLTSLDISSLPDLSELNCDKCSALKELWMKTGQSVANLTYNSSVTTIKYKD